MPSRVAALLSVVFVLAFLAGPLAGTAAASPTYTVAPSVSDNAFVGMPLTVNPADWPAGTPISDEWLRCDGTGNNCVDTFSGTSYTPGSPDLGMVLEVRETASDGTGSTTVYSNQTPVVTAAAQTSRTPPTINDTAAVQLGQVLTENHGTSMPASATYAYQWRRCNLTGSQCTNISGATAPTYTATVDDEGDSLEIMETPSASMVTQIATSSAPTAVVTANAPANSGSAPTISGTAQVGQTLSASPGAWSNSPTSYTYQWEDCDSGGQACTAIPRATGQTYQLGDNDLGHTIVVSVAGVNAGGTGAAAASAATAVVKTTSSVSFGAAPTSPVTNQGVTLVATVTSQAAAGEPSGTVVFLDGGKPISGCVATATGTAQTVTVLCQTSFPAESAQLTAVFTPAAGSVVLGSTSPVTTLPVRQDAATISLDASPLVQVHASTTYTATVAPKTVPAGPITPSGSVQFLDGGKPIAACAAQPVNGGGATCTIKYGSTGSRSITARYLGDANFTGSSSAASEVRVSALPAKGTVTATMQWTFVYAPAYTRVIAMVINGVPTGATVQILCQGRGCPFAKRSRTIGKPKRCSAKAKRQHECLTPGQVSLTPTFHSRQLRPRAQITIEIHRPRFVGKYYSFTMRPSKQPRVRIGCLAVNGTRPDVGC
jgi:Bacterial Ig-like domain (group 3)